MDATAGATGCALQMVLRWGSDVDAIGAVKSGLPREQRTVFNFAIWTCLTTGNLIIFFAVIDEGFATRFKHEGSIKEKKRRNSARMEKGAQGSLQSLNSMSSMVSSMVDGGSVTSQPSHGNGRDGRSADSLVAISDAGPCWAWDLGCQLIPMVSGFTEELVSVLQNCNTMDDLSRLAGSISLVLEFVDSCDKTSRANFHLDSSCPNLAVQLVYSMSRSESFVCYCWVLEIPEGTSTASGAEPTFPWPLSCREPVGVQPFQHSWQPSCQVIAVTGRFVC
eukprot:Skav214899  [mRNA]  locus=scaffold1561:101322:104845:- [translate_table: standard]